MPVTLILLQQILPTNHTTQDSLDSVPFNSFTKVWGKLYKVWLKACTFQWDSTSNTSFQQKHEMSDAVWYCSSRFMEKEHSKTFNTGSNLRLSSLVALQTRVKSFSYSDSEVQKRLLRLMALHLLVCLLMLVFCFDCSCIRCLSFVNFHPCILFYFCLFARLTPKDSWNLLVIWGISVWSLLVLWVLQLPPTIQTDYISDTRDSLMFRNMCKSFWYVQKEDLCGKFPNAAPRSSQLDKMLT